MIDIQGSGDDRGISIQKVGVKDVRYPIKVLDRQLEFQSTVAHVSMYVDLPHCTKGTHMSRFLEVLNRYRGEVTLRTVKQILVDMAARLDAETAHIDIAFPYFVEKEAPVSKEKGLMDYNCRFIGEYNKQDDSLDTILEVTVPVTSLCPCSKAISERGAHNQRSEVTIQVRYSDFIWIEELIEIAEASGSAPVYSLLKRVDEKYITEQAYDNPVFVEDLVRNVATKLSADNRIFWFRVESENFESIHNHNASASVERLRKTGIRAGGQSFETYTPTSPLKAANGR